MNLRRDRACSTIAVLALSSLLSARPAAAQVCLRQGCESSPPTFYATVGDENPTAIPPQWPRGLSLVGMELNFLTARETPIELAAAAYTVFGRVGGPPLRLPTPLLVDSVSPFAVGYLRSPATIVRLAVNHAAATATPGLDTMVVGSGVRGWWSDPTVACAGPHCLGAVTDAENRAQVFRYASSIDPALFAFGGSVTAVLTPAVTSRPGVAPIGSNRYALARRNFDGNTLADDVRVHDIDVSASVPREINTTARVGLASGARDSAVAAVADGGWLVVAWLAGSGATREARVAALSVNPSVTRTDGPLTIAGPFTTNARSIGLARTRDNVVLTIQDGPTVFAVPMAVVMSGGGPRLAYRMFDPTRDVVRSVRSAAIGTHRVASGPAPVLVWDELDPGRGSTTPRALGASLAWCARSTDCEFTGGAGWTGACNGLGDAGQCVPRPADAGVDSGPDARVDSGVDTGVDAGVDTGVNTGVDASTDSAMDTGVDTGVATIEDVSSERSEPDAMMADHTMMDGTSVDGSAVGDGAAPTRLSPKFNGGACQCRASGRTSRIEPPLALVLLVTLTRLVRSRRARRVG